MAESVASPILNDFPPGAVHVTPSQDTKEHVISLTETCWCTPTIQPEGEGYTTHIHHPQRPLVPGHALEIKKLHVTAAGVVEMPR